MDELSQTVAAAEAAEGATTWDEAARRYEEALTLLAGVSDAAPDEAALLTALGRCYWNMSDARASWRTLRRAMSLYQERGDPVGLARATVEILRIWGPPDRQQAMAEEALAALGEREPRLRAFLLLRLRREDEALALADAHGLVELQAFRTEREGWAAFDAGRIDEGIAAVKAAQRVYVGERAYSPAAGALRGAAFVTLQAGRIDDGELLAREALDYARGVHLQFNEQLALLDLAGVAFARCEFDRCEALIAEAPTETDFRADAYRMWITEQRGDIAGALAMLIDPARGGGALTAISQIHASSAGVLHHAGRTEPARRELEAWAEVARQDNSLCDEVAAPIDCVVELGSDQLVREIHDAFGRRPPSSAVYATLQGRGAGYARGAIALRLGDDSEAEAMFRAGLEVAERERLPIDAARCLEGLTRVAGERGDHDAAAGYRDRAAALFEQHGARLYLDRMTRAG